MRRIIGMVVGLGLGCASDSSGFDDNDDGCWTDVVAPSGSFPHPTVDDACEAFFSERDFLVTRVRIHNERDEPVILFGPTACENSLLEIREVDGSGRYPVVCADCERFMTGQCTCEECLTANQVWLEPGAGIWQEWEGFLGTAEDLPQECGRSACSGSCQRLVRAEAGDYQVTLGVAAPSDCVDEDGEACACRPNAAGVCVLDPDVEIAPLAPEESYTVTLERACDGVDVTID